jgi:hypothetical protein
VKAKNFVQHLLNAKGRKFEVSASEVIEHLDWSARTSGQQISFKLRIQVAVFSFIITFSAR